MDNILEVSGLNKRYGDFALKDISFYLPDGCIKGILVSGASVYANQIFKQFMNKDKADSNTDKEQK